MPDGQQKRSMSRFAGSCRFVYNTALALQKERYEVGEKKHGYAALCKLLTQWGANVETLWLSDAPSHPLQQSLKDLERAYSNFFAKRAEFPRLMIDFDQNQVRVTTKLAHRVLWLAGQEGVAEPVSEALFQAHFVYGKNLADAQVLIEAAAAGNIAKARVEALLNSNEGEAELAHELEQARKQGVRSVPLFVINQHHVVEGAQSAEFLASFLLEIADETSISPTNDETRCGPDQCHF